jgi:hypothetical protein
LLDHFTIRRADQQRADVVTPERFARLVRHHQVHALLHQLVARALHHALVRVGLEREADQHRQLALARVPHLRQ